MKRKLRLHRETVRQLETPALEDVRGAGSRMATLCTLLAACSAISNCYPCPTIQGPDCPYTQGCWTK